MFTCPVCYYTRMQDPPMDYNICVCCGTEFGNDDDAHSHEQLRAEWIQRGTPWFFRAAPIGWNAWTQLFAAHVGLLPYDGYLSFHGSPVPETRQVFEATNDVFALAA